MGWFSLHDALGDSYSREAVVMFHVKTIATMIPSQNNTRFSYSVIRISASSTRLDTAAIHFAHALAPMSERTLQGRGLL